jgi:hypothetical protein
MTLYRLRHLAVPLGHGSTVRVQAMHTIAAYLNPKCRGLAQQTGLLKIENSTTTL